MGIFNTSLTDQSANTIGFFVTTSKNYYCLIDRIITGHDANGAGSYIGLCYLTSYMNSAVNLEFIGYIYHFMTDDDKSK
ncbi:hypothetical protein FACS189459_6410 [Bacilli bacterium]|nr:hypothetical protein FACS189459_6410 [Bacilli bacterium]GHU52202.1 hypothetical protein FACS189496_1950 [Bacilli bacterium]